MRNADVSGSENIPITLIRSSGSINVRWTTARSKAAGPQWLGHVSTITIHFVLC